MAKKLILKGDTLKYNGRTFRISEIQERDPNTRIHTKCGHIFHVRNFDKGNPVVIRVVVPKQKTKKPQPTEDFSKFF